LVIDLAVTKEHRERRKIFFGLFYGSEIRDRDWFREVSRRRGSGFFAVKIRRKDVGSLSDDCRVFVGGNDFRQSV
jgi:hypothetical protein